MRVFAGIFLPDDLKKEIFEFSQKFNSWPVRITPEENLHITLVPPWKEDDRRSVIEKLQSVQFSEKISVVFDLVNYGPGHPPRLIWAEAVAGIHGLTALQQATLKVLGQQSERRPFRPHVTIAKFKQSEFLSLPTQALHERIDWRFSVANFSLIQSELTREGPIYTEIERFAI